MDRRSEPQLRPPAVADAPAQEHPHPSELVRSGLATPNSDVDGALARYLPANPVVLVANDGPGNGEERDLERDPIRREIERRGPGRVDLIRLELADPAPTLVLEAAEQSARLHARVLILSRSERATAAGMAGEIAAAFPGVYELSAGEFVRLPSAERIAEAVGPLLCVGGDGALVEPELILERPLPGLGAPATLIAKEPAGREPAGREPVRAAAAGAAASEAASINPVETDPVDADVAAPLPRLVFTRDDRFFPTGDAGAALGLANRPNAGPPVPANGVSRGLADVFWALLALVAAFVAEFGFIEPRRPLALSGDHLRFLADARALIEGGDLWHNPFLGFPLGAAVFDGRYALLPHALLMALGATGLGVFAVTKLFLVLCIAGTALAAYITLRMISVRPVLSAAGALAFTVSPYAAGMVFGRETLAFSPAVPLSALLCFMVAGSVQPAAGRLSRSFQAAVAFASVLLVGTWGPSDAAAAVPFLALAAIAAHIGWRRIWALPLVAVVFAALFVLVLLSGWGLSFRQGLEAWASAPLPPAPGFSTALSLADILASFPSLPGAAGRSLDVGNWFRLQEVGPGRGLWPNLAIGLALLLAPVVMLVRQARFSDRRGSSAKRVPCRRPCYLRTSAGRPRWRRISAAG